jgi:hypothetical protein
MQKCYVQSSDQPALPFTDHLEERKNGDFIVAEFDRRETRPGHEEFIWLCIKRGRRYSLVDIPFQTNGQITRLQDIRKQYNWWKRYSLYSAIGVKEVMVSKLGTTIRFLF